MKKRLLAILLTLCLVLSLVACSSGGSGDSSQTQEPSAAENGETPSQPDGNGDAEASTPPEESGGEEEPAEETVSENVLNGYGLTAEEFAALKASIQAHIDGEWDAEEPYLSRDNGGIYDCAVICTIIRDEVEDRYGADESEDMRNNAVMETFINSEIEQTHTPDHLSSLWKERNVVLAHAVNDWRAEQDISYDLYYHIWDTLASAFAAMSMAEDDTYLAPLFDLDSQ